MSPNGTERPVRHFFLVESRAGMNNGQAFRKELKEDETFETDFNGASEQDCGKWALEQQSQHLIIEQDLIAIVDERSAEDGTLLMQSYQKEESGIEYGE